MKRLIFLILVLIPTAVLAQFTPIGIYFTFANAEITESDGDSFFEFDVMVHGDDASTKYGDLQILLNYNTDAFGESIESTGNVIITPGALMVPPFYVNHESDNMSDVLYVSCEYQLDVDSFATDLPATPTSLFHIKIKIQDSNQRAGIFFLVEEMVNQQFYFNHEDRYDPVVAQDTLNDPLDGSTVPVVLSSFTAAINPRGNILLTWVTQTESNCLGYRIFRNQEDDLATALDLQTLINATNTSQQQTYCFEDQELQEDGEFFYWLQSVDLTGESTFYGPISMILEGQETDAPEAPLINKLHNAYPNPFNPSTTISYSLLHPSAVMLDIYNTRGQKVRSFNAQHYQAGLFSIIWDGKDHTGRKVPSGIYYYRLQAGSYRETKKMVMSK